MGPVQLGHSDEDTARTTMRRMRELWVQTARDSAAHESFTTMVFEEAGLRTELEDVLDRDRPRRELHRCISVINQDTGLRTSLPHIGIHVRVIEGAQPCCKVSKRGGCATEDLMALSPQVMNLDATTSGGATHSWDHWGSARAPAVAWR
jgi:hypothetical protein